MWQFVGDAKYDNSLESEKLQFVGEQKWQFVGTTKMTTRWRPKYDNSLAVQKWQFVVGAKYDNSLENIKLQFVAR